MEQGQASPSLALPVSQETAVYLGEVSSRASGQFLSSVSGVQGPPGSWGWRGEWGGVAASEPLPGAVCEGT